VTEEQVMKPPLPGVRHELVLLCWKCHYTPISQSLPGVQ